MSVKTKSSRLLVILIKNLEYGKVKTRLAKSIGKGNALAVYKKLLDHTKSVCDTIYADKAIFYSDFIPKIDIWDKQNYHRFLQLGIDVGERMYNAFQKAYSLGYREVVLIGGDIVELHSGVINDAFKYLSTNDVVIGPAKDGGYYLIGMKTIQRQLFFNKSWSNESVFTETKNDLIVSGISYQELEKLADIDREEDLEKYGDMIQINSILTPFAE